jgi:hypothetical protein
MWQRSNRVLFDKGILHRLAQCDVMPAPPVPGPTSPELLSSEFRADI